MKRRAIRLAVLASASTAAALLLPASAMATPTSNVHAAGVTMTFWYGAWAGNGAGSGSWTAFAGDGQIGDLNSYTFLGAASGQGQRIGNNAHSAKNFTTNEVGHVYTLANYGGGASCDFSPVPYASSGGNLCSGYVNNERSFRMES